MDSQARKSRNIVRRDIAGEQNQHPGNGGRKPMAQRLTRPSIAGRMIEDQRQHHAEKNWSERRLTKEFRKLPIRKKTEWRKADEHVRQDDQRWEGSTGQFLKRRNHQIELLLSRKTPGGSENARHRHEIRKVEQCIRQLPTDSVGMFPRP